MTAWSILTGNSTAPIGSIAWVHLNNQVGDGGGTVIIGGNRTANMELSLASNIMVALSSSLKSLKLTADKPVGLSANINQNFQATIG